jgi:hypothetical protein
MSLRELTLQSAFFITHTSLTDHPKFDCFIWGLVHQDYPNSGVMEHLNAINGLEIFRNSDFPILGGRLFDFRLIYLI